jgi:D-glucuronyl C5-epimerase C-terminus
VTPASHARHRAAATALPLALALAIVAAPQGALAAPPRAPESRTAAAAALELAPVSGAARPASRRPAHAREAAARTSVTQVLQRLLAGGAIDEADAHRYFAAYAAAVRSYGHLSGTRHEELGTVLANVQAMAAGGQLIASRLPVVFLTLERNRQWWTNEPLLSSGARVSFPHSLLVWEYYEGQGLEIQWLATFGKANGYFLSGHENGTFKALLAEALPLASTRAGGLTWEYLFEFDGGRPPWTSGLSQGTALQVLARAYQRFKDPNYLSAAQRALAIFRSPPPAGVRVATRAGANYAEYSYAPGDRILNGFIQALVGLYDYASLTGDPQGRRLFEEGDAEARLQVPHYDTGAWSLYDQYGESNLNYHELLTEFLQHLCSRTQKGEPGGETHGSGAPSTPPGTTTAPGQTTTPNPTSTPAPGTAAAATAPSATAIPGDDVYCTTAQHFSADLHTPPVVALLSRSLHAASRAGVQISLSKISTVTMTVRRAGSVVWRNSATLERGRPRLLWVTPRATGSYTVTIVATDLAGNFASTTGTVAVGH